MYRKFSVQVLAAIAISAVGLGIAANAGEKYQNGKIRSAATAECNRQTWPAFDAECLLTVDGKPVNGTIRIVAAF